MSGIIGDNLGRSGGLVKAVSAAGGSYTHIKTVTLSSGVSSVDFIDGTSDVVMDTTYPRYLIEFDRLGAATADQLIEARVTGDGGSSWLTATADHFNVRAGFKADGSTTSDAGSWNNGEFVTLTANSAIQDFHGMSGQLHLYGVGVSTRPMCAGHIASWGNHGIAYVVMGVHNATLTMDGIQFICNNGSTNLDSGSISLYGISR
jgi:hypothetical protein